MRPLLKACCPDPAVAPKNSTCVSSVHWISFQSNSYCWIIKTNHKGLGKPLQLHSKRFLLKSQLSKSTHIHKTTQDSTNMLMWHQHLEKDGIEPTTFKLPHTTESERDPFQSYSKVYLCREFMYLKFNIDENDCTFCNNFFFPVVFWTGLFN